MLVDKFRGCLWVEMKYSVKDKFSYGYFELDDKILCWGDLILVMGGDEKDLFKWCIVVIFVM